MYVCIERALSHFTSSLIHTLAIIFVLRFVMIIMRRFKRSTNRISFAVSYNIIAGEKKLLANLHHSIHYIHMNYFTI